MMMKLLTKPVRFILSFVVVVTLYVKRPPTMRLEVFVLLLLGAMTIVNLALTWGRRMASARSASAPTVPGTVPRAQGSATAPVRKPWLMATLGFACAAGLGIIKAHEIGIWLWIPVAVLVGFQFSYFVFKTLR
jgi:hypothetical protein